MSTKYSSLYDIYFVVIIEESYQEQYINEGGRYSFLFVLANSIKFEILLNAGTYDTW